MYIVLVPVLGLFLGKRPPAVVWISVVVAVVGLYFLSWTGEGGVNIGDIYLIGCALTYAVQITLVDRLSPGLDASQLHSVYGRCGAVGSGDDLH